MPETPSVGVSSTNSNIIRPDRPCDRCRRRKSRCVLDSEHSTTCVLCAFHNQKCTFLEDAAPRRRKVRALSGDDGGSRSSHVRSPSSQLPRRQSETIHGNSTTVNDYADLKSSSLLKKTLGLQNHRHARYLGSTDLQDDIFLDSRHYDSARNESATGLGSFRRVAIHQFFYQHPDAECSDHAQDVEDLDTIEQLVTPYGHALIRLYFRIVHPTFPILHKKVYLEKYGRSHREFSPPLLAAVYLLALNWWSYSSELTKLPKPDVQELENLALKALWRISHRAKLSTVQAGLLLSQKPNISSWALTSLIVGIAQDLGLHLDSTQWQIPAWERGLRKRLGWAVFMQDTWSALIYGRPRHLSLSNWGLSAVVSSDFPESAADEDDEEGSTEVEKGRTLFSAMITLTKILSEVLENMYSLKAEREIAEAKNSTEAILAQAKPAQLQLRAWYSQMPDSLRMDTPTKTGKLDSVGYLHLAYYATEMTIHRKILKALSRKTDPYLIQVCRTAAKSRLTSAVELFDRLKPEHLQSFWYFASDFNFALIGVFAALCLATSTSPDEAAYYQERLQKYRWTLRVWSSGAEFFRDVGDSIAAVVEPLMVNLSRKSDSLGAAINTGQDLFWLAQDSADERDDDDSIDDVDHTGMGQFLQDLSEIDSYLDDASMHTV